MGKQSAQQIVEEILKSPVGTKLQLLAPIVVNRKGEHHDLLDDALKRGFSRARVDGKVRSLEEKIELDKKTKHDVELVIDRLVLKADLRPRLTDSVEKALREGKGVLIVTDENGARSADRTMSEHNACHHCGLSFPELAPQLVLLQQPAGHVPRVQRPGHARGDGPGPDRPRQDPVDQRRRGRAVGLGSGARRRLDGGPGRHPRARVRHRPRDAVGQAAQEADRHRALRQPAAKSSP